MCSSRISSAFGTAALVLAQRTARGRMVPIVSQIAGGLGPGGDHGPLFLGKRSEQVRDERGQCLTRPSAPSSATTNGTPLRHQASGTHLTRQRLRSAQSEPVVFTLPRPTGTDCARFPCQSVTDQTCRVSVVIGVGRQRKEGKHGSQNYGRLARTSIVN